MFGVQLAVQQLNIGGIANKPGIKAIVLVGNIKTKGCNVAVYLLM
jgi:hypothetical protein